jgi:ferrous iron transport protein A
VFKKLSDIKPGTKAIIRSFTENELYVKLMEMGCVPGETIQVENIAPFKDPISVLVSGYRLSLRLEEADNIVVEEII